MASRDKRPKGDVMSAALMSELRDVRDELERGEEVDLKRLRLMVSAVIASAHQESDEAKRELIEVIRELELTVREAAMKTQQQLLGLGQKAKAVRGYGALRSHQTSQRVFTKA